MKKSIIAMITIIVIIFSYVPTKAKANTAKVCIPLKNVVEGFKSEETFNFSIEDIGEKKAPLPNNTLISIKGSGEEFINLEFSSVGEYQYLIKEIKGSTETMEYDNTVYSLTIDITEQEGNLTPTVKIDTSEKVKPEKVVFTNYSLSCAIYQPKIKKEIENNKDYNDSFVFVLENEKGEKEKVSIKGEGITSFSQMQFKKEGTYKYKVYEEKKDTTNWNYDDKIYNCELKVTKKDNKFYIKANYYTMKFVNEPTLIKKAKHLISKVAGYNSKNYNKIKTGDTEDTLGLIIIILFIAFTVFMGVSVKKK